MGRWLDRLRPMRGRVGIDAQAALAFLLACIFFGGVTFFALAPPPERPWDALTAISTWASVLALLVAAWVALRQLSQLRATYQVDAFIRLADSIDSPTFRKALNELIDMEAMLHNPDALADYYYSLSPKERDSFWERADTVGNALERIGAMVAYGALDRNLILDYMAPTVLHAYNALEFRWRDVPPGEGWFFLQILAREATTYLAGVRKSEGQFCYFDADPGSDLTLSVQADCRTMSVLPYRLDGTMFCYRLPVWVKNNTDRRVRAMAEVTLSVEPPYSIRARVQPEQAPGGETLPMVVKELHTHTQPATLSVDPRGRQRVSGFIVVGPGGEPPATRWRIATLKYDPVEYDGVIEIRYGERTAAVAELEETRAAAH